MGRIFLTSDLHFAHNKDFLYGKRGFDNVDQMNAFIIYHWNKMVSDDDDIYVLGDIMLNNDDIGKWALANLRGHLHIVRGNHDSDRRIEFYNNSWNVVEIQNSIYLNYQGLHFYLTHYPTITSNFDLEKPLKARLINLCGHSHIQNPFEDWVKYNAPIYHCELDAHDCKVIALDDIINEINTFVKK